MFKRIREDSGFTLIELLVVILIIGILLAVALPSFLGQTQKANVSAAQQAEYSAYIAAKSSTVTIADTSGTYDTGSTLVSDILAVDPSADVVAGDSATYPEIGVGNTSGTTFSAATVTPDGQTVTFVEGSGYGS